MTFSKKKIAELDKFYAPCGPCGICGGPDKRHRLWDVMMDSPESDEQFASAYEVDVGHVRAVRQIRPYRRARRM